MAPRKPGAGRKPAKSELASGLLKALEFVGVLKGPNGLARQPYMDFTFMAGGWAIGYDGIVAAGHLIDDQVQGYVNTKLLTEALNNSDKNFSYSVGGDGSFLIESGAYNSLVPSLPIDQCIPTYPDGNLENSYALTKRFTEALVTAGKVVSDNAEFVVGASVRLNNQTVMATDGETIIEAWHGSVMPIGPLVPKQFATALGRAAKLKGEPIAWNVSPDYKTLTVHFADKSWLRTTLYSEAWPSELLEKFNGFFEGVTTAEAPKGLFDAVRKVLPWADETNNVLIRAGSVRTHPDKRQGSAQDVAAINFDLDVDGKIMLEIEPHAAMIGLNQRAKALVFYSAKDAETGFSTIRGVMGGRAPADEWQPEQPAAPVTEAAPGGWETVAAELPTSSPEAAPEQGGWVIAEASPPVEETPVVPRDRQAVDPNIYVGLEGLPAGGLNQLEAEQPDEPSATPMSDWLAIAAATGDMLTVEDE